MVFDISLNICKDMAEISLIRMLIAFFILYVSLILIQSFSMWLLIKISIKNKWIKVKNFSYKKILHILLLVFGIHFVSTVISLSLGLIGVNKWIEISFIIIHILITIFAMSYVIYLIRKVFNLKWTISINIYVLSGIISWIIITILISTVNLF